jgi:hypothetical protein
MRTKAAKPAKAAEREIVMASSYHRAGKPTVMELTVA